MAQADALFEMPKSLVSSCNAVTVTASGFSSTQFLLPSSSPSSLTELGGTYVPREGSTAAGRAVYSNTLFAGAVLYWVEALEADDRRRLREVPTPDRVPQPPHRHHPIDELGLKHPENKGVFAVGNGASTTCDTGKWIVQPDEKFFPMYMTHDCAYHPVDITSADWYVVACAGCAEEAVTGSFTIECSSTKPAFFSLDSSLDYSDTTFGSVATTSPDGSSSTGADPPSSGNSEVFDDSSFSSSESSEAPSLGPLTNSPAVIIHQNFPTVAPETGTVVGLLATCGTVEVNDVGSDREFSQQGELRNGRYVYQQHSDGSILYWSPILGRRKRRLSLWDRLMKTGPEASPLAAADEVFVPPAPPSHPEQQQQQRRSKSKRINYVQGRDSRSSSSSGGEGGVLDGVGFPSAVGARALKGSEIATHSLDMCTDGVWLLLDSSHSYPIIFTYDCASHPAEISADWYVQESYLAPLYKKNSQLTITCPGGESYSTSSSIGAVAQIVAGDEEDDDFQGEIFKWLLAAVALCGILVAAIVALLCWILRSRKLNAEAHQETPQPLVVAVP